MRTSARIRPLVRESNRRDESAAAEGRSIVGGGRLREGPRAVVTRFNRHRH